MKVTISLRSPLSHGSFSDIDTGNSTPIRREPVVSLPGMPRIPCVSGNALRGVMRRAIMRELFDACGVSRDTLPAAHWDRLYAALANGGNQDKGPGVSRIDPGYIRQIRAALPPLSLFGMFGYDEQHRLASRFQCGFAWLVCAETVAAGLVDGSAPGVAADLQSETSLCRHVDREEQDSAVSGVTPMPTTMETICAGAQLQTEIRFLRAATEVERSCAAHALDLIADGSIGAKGAAGFGRVSIVADEGDPKPYREWLASSVEPTRDFLGRLAASMARKL